MKLRQIQQLIAGVDPQARHYENTKDGSDYTVWMEYQRTGLSADDEGEEGWKFEVNRFTKQEYDPVAEALENALKADPRIAFTYNVDYEQETGYIRHLFDCVGA